MPATPTYRPSSKIPAKPFTEMCPLTVKGITPPLYIVHCPSYTFSAKEKDSETGLSYFGARYYSSDLSVWLSVDPQAAKYPSLSPYTYCANNPVKLVDPNGEEVEITYNKTTNTLYVIDKDIYRQDLPKIYVSAENYKMGGIRNDKGELTCNQVLVIDNVFSGGEVSDEGKIVRDSEKSYEKAIPNGSYDIVDNKASTDHPEWFRLEKRDSSPYNDTDDNSGRDGFRLHLGTISYGCVTIDQNKKESKKSWNVLTNILNKTSTTTVKERRGRQWLNPFSRLTRYGTLRVIGTDNLPSK